MDFPVCPSCHQSVIDDDAADCPFCGASMKAKPSSKAAAPAASAAPVAKPVVTTGKPAPAVAKPGPVAAKSTGAKPLAGKGKVPDDDFPFDLELTAGKSAIPAMPNPTKQRTLKVICPMCDTPGYLPPTAAGKEVRCSNAKCAMPVFTAPSDKKAERTAPAPPPKRSKMPIVLVTIAVVALGAIGFGVYAFGLLPGGKQSGKKTEIVLDDEQRALLDELAGKKKPVAADAAQQNANAKPPADDKQAGKHELTKEWLITESLKQMKASALEPGKYQKSKPYCRQLAAEANAVTGHPDAAKEHLTQLMAIANNVSYYRIIPLLDTFWVASFANDANAAGEALQVAIGEVPKLPKYGRSRYEVAGRLAAAMVAVGQGTDAAKLLAEIHPIDANAQFVGRLHLPAESQLAARIQLATDAKVLPLSDSYSVLPWMYPQEAAATGSLISRGLPDNAAEWALGQVSEDAKAECLSIWAQDHAQKHAAVGAADADNKIATAVGSLPPALAARVWTRAGYGRWLAKDQAGVKAAIDLAEKLLATVPKPAPATMPAIEVSHRYKEPAVAPLVQAAIGVGELAFLQAQSPETVEDAGKSLDTAIAFLDAIAPASEIAKNRFDESKQPRLKDDLKRLMNLKTDDQARIALTKYKAVVTEILNASKLRFELETTLLLRLRGAGVGLSKKVWEIVRTRSTATDPAEKDDFFTTELPGELIEGLKNSDGELELMAVWRERFPKLNRPHSAAIELSERLISDPDAAVKLVQALKPNQREQLLPEVTTKLADAGKAAAVLAFIGKLTISDPLLKEDCYRMTAAIAAKKGQTELVWNQVPQVVQHTEKVALCRGLIDGLLAAEPPGK